MQPLSSAPRDGALAPPALQIYLLGPPRAAWHGQPLTIPRRQARALLYRLAAEPQPVPRDHLCYLFWPDTGETTARHNLSRLLTILHQTLPDPHLLCAQEDQIVLDPQGTWSDTRAFDECWVTWCQHGDPACLRAAADLYRGPFLAGFVLPDSAEFDAWVRQAQEFWTRRYLQTLAALSETLTTNGDYAGASEVVRRYLATDELAEAMHRRLIELYALAGDRSAALQQYETCVTILERELGVDPTPATRAAYRTILQGNLPDAVLPPRPAWTTLPAVEVPLVGRAAEMGILAAAAAQACVGRGRVVLIAGEPGVGKSRLMQEFTGRLRSQARILSGCGYPETATAPYQPLIDALRPHLQMARFEFDVYPAWMTHLAQLFPELRPRHPDLPMPAVSEPGWARTRLFEALLALMVHLAAGVSPVVVCLDDLHWADSGTLDWLGYLGRRIHGLPLLVVGTYRTEEAGPLGELRSSLARQYVLHELVLPGLNEPAIDELLQHLAHTLAPDPGLAGRLHQVTAGNPFFVLETLLALSEAGVRAEPAGVRTSLPLPDSVCQAVRLRVARLSPAARQVLEAAAILGQPFDAGTVQLTAGRGELETADALDELCARQLLVEDGDRLHFRHEIVREAVDAGLSAQRSRLLHRRAGEVLERVQPEDAGALARHFAAGARPGRAARCALQAGLAAKLVYAHVEARHWFDQALVLLAQEAASLHDPAAMADNQRRRIQALSERGWVLRLLGDMDAYVRDLAEEAQLVEALGDPRMLAHLRWRQASAHLWFCRFGAARAAAEEGRQVAQAVGDTYLEAMCWRAAGLAARDLGMFDQAQAALEEALRLFGVLDQAGLRVHTLGHLSTLAAYRGDYQRASALAQQALVICDAGGLWTERRIALGDLGAAAAGLGDVALAARCLSESLDVAGQVSDRTQEILCHGHLGWLAVATGQTARAFEHLHAAQALAEEISSCAEQAWLHAGLAEALRQAGDVAAALAHARQAQALAEASGRVVDRAVVKGVLARLSSVC